MPNKYSGESRHSVEQLNNEIAELKEIADRVSQKAHAMVKTKLDAELAYQPPYTVQYAVLKALYDYMELRKIEE